MSGRTEDPVVLIDDEEPDESTNVTKQQDEISAADAAIAAAAAAAEAADDNDDSDPEEYVVEAIRQRKKDPKTGNDLYLVKWEDYPETDNTWEPAENLKCPEIVQKFLDEESGKRKRKKVEKNHANSKSQTQSSAKKPKRASTSKSREFVEFTSDEDDSTIGDISETHKQRQPPPSDEAITEPAAPKGFERGLEIERILTAVVGDNDRLYFFVKWQGVSELELIEVNELEKHAAYDLCKWYGDRFFSNIKYNKSP